MAKKSIRTTILLERLSRADSIHTFIGRHEQHMAKGSLKAFLREKCEQGDHVRENVIMRSGVDRTYGHQIFRGARRPSRDKLLQLALGFPLTLAETQEMLLLADKRCLHPRVLRDDVIIFSLQRGLSIADTEEMLADLSLPPLEGKTI